MINLEKELIQIRPSWYPYNNGVDVNIWSKIHPRFVDHDGCVVDLGCLGWNNDFNDRTSDNWAGYFFDKKRVIGVDPQESENPNAEFFKGFVSTFSGKANLSNSGHAGQLVESSDGEYDVLTWEDFKKKFSIDSISILKINIEGSEWGLLSTFEKDDFNNIDQIAISFHHFIPQFSNNYNLSMECVKKLESFGYYAIDLGIYGWYLFVKK